METYVRFTRPETRDTVARVFVPDKMNPMEQVRRLRALGYSIVDINPPLPTDANS